MNYIELTKDEELLEFFIDCIESTEWSQKEISLELGCNPKSVVVWAKNLKLNIATKSQCENIIHDIILFKEQVENEGLSILELKNYWACSTGVLYNKIKEHNLMFKLKELEQRYNEKGITQSILQDLFIYNKNTGIFTNKIYRNSNAKKGDIAGYKDRNGYIVIKIFKDTFLAHRLVFLYVDNTLDSNKVVDHINHVRDINSYNNLRQITKAENAKNRVLDNKNFDIYKRNNKFSVQIGGEKYGTYNIIEDAISVRDKKLQELGYHENHGKPLPKGISYTKSNNKRKLLIKEQTPKDTDKKLLQLILDNTPEGYHDDHIKPLSKGGLHEPKNIQYITAKENSMKSDKYPYICKTAIDPISYLINKGLLGA